LILFRLLVEDEEPTEVALANDDIDGAATVSVCEPNEGKDTPAKEGLPADEETRDPMFSLNIMIILETSSGLLNDVRCCCCCCISKTLLGMLLWMDIA
jgi:hypothetical protein